MAHGLDDATLPHLILAPFRLDQLTATHAPQFGALSARYTTRWTKEQVKVWRSQGLHQMPTSAWVNNQLPALNKELRHRGAGAFADQLIDHLWEQLRTRVAEAARTVRKSDRESWIPELGDQLAVLLTHACERTGASMVSELHALRAALNIAILRADSSNEPSALKDLAQHCAAGLDEVLALPRRSAIDWSIVFTGCGCESCARLQDFLAEPRERELSWPLAKDKRQHIHQQIDNAQVPVAHVTLRQGRPFTLQLVKSESLFIRAKTLRAQQVTDRQWIAQHWGY